MRLRDVGLYDVFGRYSNSFYPIVGVSDRMGVNDR